ncbi:MAG TPA: hypothetical protein VIM14_16045 [Polyangia bacterium]
MSVAALLIGIAGGSGRGKTTLAKGAVSGEIGGSQGVESVTMAIHDLHSNQECGPSPIFVQ